MSVVCCACGGRLVWNGGWFHKVGQGEKIWQCKWAEPVEYGIAVVRNER